MCVTEIMLTNTVCSNNKTDTVISILFLEKKKTIEKMPWTCGLSKQAVCECLKCVYVYVCVCIREFVCGFYSQPKIFYCLMQ